MTVKNRFSEKIHLF
jgi:hypothetical protein